MATALRRLLILGAQEIDDIYGLPCFTEDDRRLYFDLSPAEREAVDAVYTISVAVHLTLQIGYFVDFSAFRCQAIQRPCHSASAFSLSLQASAVAAYRTAVSAKNALR